jgi:hypothetical protein
MWNSGFLGRVLRLQLVSGFFETFLVDVEFQELSNKPLQARFGHFLHELWWFVFFLWSEGSLGRALGQSRSQAGVALQEGQKKVWEGQKVGDQGRGRVNLGLTMGECHSGVWLGQLPRVAFQRPPLFLPALSYCADFVTIESKHSSPEPWVDNANLQSYKYNNYTSNRENLNNILH